MFILFGITIQANMKWALSAELNLEQLFAVSYNEGVVVLRLPEGLYGPGM